MADITSNLVGHWPLQDNAASTVVVGVVGGNATLSGGDNTSTLSTAGPGGSLPLALLLDGTSDIIVATPGTISRNQSAITIAGWIKTTDTDGQPFYVKGASLARAAINIVSSKLLCGGRAGDAEGFQGKTTVADRPSNVWFHSAVTIDYANDLVVAYVDGVAASTTGTISFTATATSDTESGAINFGGTNGTASLAGALADVRIYHRALAADDIKALYAMGHIGAISDYYRRLRGGN